MAPPDMVDLELFIKQLPGVLGCVILTNSDGSATEIQAFTRSDTDRASVQRSILDEVTKRGLSGPLKQVYVFELEAESTPGDRTSLERAAELAEQEARARGPSDASADPISVSRLDESRGRPPLGKVVLTSSAWRSEAEVALGPEGEQVVGQARGEKTPHGLKVLAEATLEAAAKLVESVEFKLVGASLVSTFEQEAVLVIVAFGDDRPMTLGAALVREGPVTEAAVRATLDAINRRLAQER